MKNLYYPLDEVVQCLYSSGVFSFDSARGTSAILEWSASFAHSIPSQLYGFLIAKRSLMWAMKACFRKHRLHPEWKCFKTSSHTSPEMDLESMHTTDASIGCLWWKPSYKFAVFDEAKIQRCLFPLLRVVLYQVPISSHLSSESVCRNTCCFWHPETVRLNSTIFPQTNFTSSQVFVSTESISSQSLLLDTQFRYVAQIQEQPPGRIRISLRYKNRLYMLRYTPHCSTRLGMSLSNLWT
jgi:hypothetical protein